MLDRRERDLRRDGPLMALGLAGVVAVVALEPGDAAALASRVAHQFLFGLAIGVTSSGLFRATARAGAVSTLALAVGFAFGAGLDVL